LDAFRDITLQRRTLEETGHRPWPLPEGRWVQGQTWSDLLFAHWPVEPAALRAVLPPQLPLDLWGERGWLGVTPFRVRGLRLLGSPPVPPMSSFPELNVRTYVTIDGKPGIYFLSLDAGSRLAVTAARRAYRLPYFRARMSVRLSAGRVLYKSERISRDGPSAAFEGEYGPSGGDLPGGEALARWLAERYCLYVVDEVGTVLRADIHHPPWPLEAASAEIGLNTMGAPFGLELTGQPLLHFARRQDTLIWALGPA
jgi:uncharacterized protein YqjF (DUF2071 family)